MVYELYTKDNKEQKKHSFYGIAKSFTEAIKIDKNLRTMGCEHILCLGVKENE